MKNRESIFLTLEEAKTLEKWYSNHPLNWIGVWVNYSSNNTKKESAETPVVV